jgi:hypothetical protein
MAGLSRPKDGVASLAYVPAINALLCGQGVDARHKAGHDVEGLVLNRISPLSTTYRSFSTIAATFSPIMMVGKLVLAQGTLGMIEASATRRPCTP